MKKTQFLSGRPLWMAPKGPYINDTYYKKVSKKLSLLREGYMLLRKRVRRMGKPKHSNEKGEWVDSPSPFHYCALGIPSSPFSKKPRALSHKPSFFKPLLIVEQRGLARGICCEQQFTVLDHRRVKKEYVDRLMFCAQVYSPFSSPNDQKMSF